MHLKKKYCKYMLITLKASPLPCNVANSLALIFGSMFSLLLMWFQ